MEINEAQMEELRAALQTPDLGYTATRSIFFQIQRRPP